MNPSSAHPLTQKPFLQIEDLSISHKKLSVLKNVSMNIEEEEIVCLLGPSGCGKTTLLRTIAGFTRPQGGKILQQGRTISESTSVLPPAQRNMGMVFQDLALFPHLTVEENILISMKDTSLAKAQKRVATLAEALKLTHVIKKYPHTISGGEQQRTALARAIAPQPKILLLDEPLASQDIDLKQKLLISLKEILKRERMTAIFVTHAQDEAFSLADKLGVINNHGIEQFGSPYDVYFQPNSRFIADFIGRGSFVSGLIEDGTLISEFGRIKKFQLVGTSKESLPTKSNSATTPYKRPSMKVKVLVRPDDVHLDNRSAIRAEIVQTLFQGSHFLYLLKLSSGTRLLSLMPSLHRYNEGDSVGVTFSFRHIVVFT